jgi:hypothetical protein
VREKSRRFIEEQFVVARVAATRPTHPNHMRLPTPALVLWPMFRVPPWVRVAEACPPPKEIRVRIVGGNYLYGPGAQAMEPSVNLGQCWYQDAINVEQYRAA